MLRTIPLEEG